MKSVRTVILSLVVMALALVCVLLLSQELAAAPVLPADMILASPEPMADGATSGAWSSDWITFPVGTCQTLNHNLGGDPDDYGVEVWFLDTDGSEGMHRKYYGGSEIAGRWRGANWQHLESNTIEVCRGSNDYDANRLRVRVWELTENPDFDSGWRDIGPGVANSLTINHNLGITPTELAVTLWFSGTEKGIHHYAYGGLYDGGADKLQGAYWQRLTENTVEVSRMPSDEYVEQVRVIVTCPDPPNYDSLVAEGSWRVRNVLAAEVFSHTLNWNPNLLMVRTECQSPTFGIHQRDAGLTFYGGPGWQGAYIHNLTSDSVAVSWGLWDTACDEVRVRIWRRGTRVYLPFVVKGP